MASQVPPINSRPIICKDAAQALHTSQLVLTGSIWRNAFIRINIRQSTCIYNR